jgi:hypothetical protein
VFTIFQFEDNDYIFYIDPHCDDSKGLHFIHLANYSLQNVPYNFHLETIQKTKDFLSSHFAGDFFREMVSKFTQGFDLPTLDEMREKFPKIFISKVKLEEELEKGKELEKEKEKEMEKNLNQLKAQDEKAPADSSIEKEGANIEKEHKEAKKKKKDKKSKKGGIIKEGTEDKQQKKKFDQDILLQAMVSQRRAIDEELQSDDDEGWDDNEEDADKEEEVELNEEEDDDVVEKSKEKPIAIEEDKFGTDERVSKQRKIAPSNRGRVVESKGSSSSRSKKE